MGGYRGSGLPSPSRAGRGCDGCVPDLAMSATGQRAHGDVIIQGYVLYLVCACTTLLTEACHGRYVISVMPSLVVVYDPITFGNCC